MPRTRVQVTSSARLAAPVAPAQPTANQCQRRSVAGGASFNRDPAGSAWPRAPRWVAVKRSAARDGPALALVGRRLRGSDWGGEPGAGSDLDSRPRHSYLEQRLWFRLGPDRALVWLGAGKLVSGVVG